MPNKVSAADAISSSAASSPDFVQSLARGLLVIRAFSAETPAMTLSEVARATGLTRAAARRFLHTLEVLGYVRSSDRYFSLQPKVLDLGYSYLSSLRIWEIAEYHMEALVKDLEESCSITVLDGLDIVYVARVATKRIFSAHLSVGSRLPAYPCAMGRVLLAYLPPDELDAYLAKAKLDPLTPKTITDEKKLRSLLGTIRQQGWCLVDQELEDGIRVAAAPVRRGENGPVIAAMNVSSHATRVKTATIRSVHLPRLLETAAAVSRELGRHAGVRDAMV
jgi:IclR family pca regulon transcriptional regulator